MDLASKLEHLRTRVDDTITTVRAAADENRQQIKQRIDKAQVDANLALKDTEQKAGQAASAAQSKWAQMKADAAAKMAEAKAKIDKRGDQIDASMAETDAEMAESDAAAAINFAAWAIDNARLAALDALDARAFADERIGAANG